MFPMFCISIILVSNLLNFLEVKLKEMGMCSWERGSKPFWGLLKTAVIFSCFHMVLYMCGVKLIFFLYEMS